MFLLAIFGSVHRNSDKTASDNKVQGGSVPLTTQTETYENQGIEHGKLLFLNADTADVRFSFDSNDGAATVVPAHKVLLATISDVFKVMFNGPMREMGNVHIPDVTDAEFMEFLQYFYLNKIKLSAEHIEGVLHLGDKYNVEKCVSDCVQFLIKFLENENVCSRLRLAILYGQTELMKACEKHILVNTAAVFETDGFLACDRQVLAHILQMDQFSCSEVKVFEAIMAWVQVKSKQDVLTIELVRAHLGNLFFEIRFASIDMDDFTGLEQKYPFVLVETVSIKILMMTLSEKCKKRIS